MKTENEIKLYKAWNLPVRLFHWINFICVILLSILGLIMLNKGSIGISGREAGIGLKSLHVLVGYVFSINLLIRLLMGFFSNSHSRWRTLLPGRNFKQQFKSFQSSVKSGQTQTFIGHNPKGRLSVLILMLLLTLMMTTGLIRAATDIYYPPFGHMAATYVAADGVPAADIKPYDKTGTNAERMAEIQAFKKPVGNIHVYGAYVLWVLILIHIIAVIRTETAGNGSLISAMFSGKKYLPREPVDK
jgi:Ni/Fe-hydrogenase 1 B-type cytochrome subunit